MAARCSLFRYRSGNESEPHIEVREMTATILLIDDDETLLELLSEHLRAASFEPRVAGSGEEGVRLAFGISPDLVVLDVMMPGLDGWEVCRRLRERAATPIIMLTAKDEEFDKLRGFHLGVDDYVTKPFSFSELIARIRAVLARTSRAIPGDRLTSGDLTIHFDQHRVTLAAETVELSPTEYRLLETLARHAHRTMPAERLVIDVWGQNYAGEAEHVKHYIWALRKKLEYDPGNPQHILTERGYGYRFE